MIVSYCKKCKMETAGVVCSQCGKKQPAANVRDVWRAVRVPVADASAWRSALWVLLLTAALLFLLLFGAERLMSSSVKFDSVLGSQLTTYVLLVPVAGLALLFLALSLQGREEIRYSLDTTGAHLQVWHRASRVRSLARLQAPRLSDAVLGQDGMKYTLADERHMLWQDVNEIKYSQGAGLIRLYHTPHLAPFQLRIPAEEYDTAEAIIKKYTKLKG